MTDSSRIGTAAPACTIAEGDRAHRIRLEQAARVIVTARRAAALPVAVADPALRAVGEIARQWDETAVTALEYAESLPVVALDRLLRAAPAWATALAVTPARLAA